MNKDEILILKPLFPVEPKVAHDIREMVFKQMEEGIVLLPFGYEVVFAPKDVEIKTEPHEYTNEELAEAFLIMEEEVDIYGSGTS